ncbi:hypothetical protein Droror1_Dr00004598 [Drosera rotundifolia]
MAALKHEGKRLAPFILPNPNNSVRSTLLPSQEEACVGVRYISTQDVRNRMKSVKNIQKITKATKMVAASKLRQHKSRCSTGHLNNVGVSILGIVVKKSVVVAISSDKGLCGSPDKKATCVILGEKAKAQLIRDSKKDIELSITELQKIPLTYTQIVERESEPGGKVGALDSYEVEGGETKSEILLNLTEFQFSCELFNAVLENASSEQGARISAMDISSRNAGEMLKRLTLSYNRTRQASITKELNEIISGASALEGK